MQKSGYEIEQGVSGFKVTRKTLLEGEKYKTDDEEFFFSHWSDAKDWFWREFSADDKVSGS